MFKLLRKFWHNLFACEHEWTQPDMPVRKCDIHGHLHDLSHRKDNRDPWHCLVQIEQTLAPVNLKHLIDTHLKERT